MAGLVCVAFNSLRAVMCCATCGCSGDGLVAYWIGACLMIDCGVDLVLFSVGVYCISGICFVAYACLGLAVIDFCFALVGVVNSVVVCVLMCIET